MKVPARKNIGPPFETPFGEPKAKPTEDGQVQITDKNESCIVDECACVCYHIHDKILGLFVMDKNRTCSLHP